MRKGYNGRFSPARRAEVAQKTKGHCWYCGCKLSPAKQSGDGKCASTEYVIDHADPLIQGGTDHVDNLVPACRTCNATKLGKTVEEYRYMLRWRYAGVDRFTESQIEWLLMHDIELPQPPDVVFYFEEMDGGL